MSNDEETKRLLVMLMNRYDMRPSAAGNLLAEIDKLAADKVTPECVICQATDDVYAYALTEGRPVCRSCFTTWYDSGTVHGEEILAERKRRAAAGLYPFGEPPAYKP